jgi:hypothetical protein
MKLTNRYSVVGEKENENAPKKMKLIKDERLRKINAGVSGAKFITNAELEALGDELVAHARHCRTDEALKILEGDVDPDRKDWGHFFWTPAHWACRHNDLRLLRSLHANGANLEIKDRPDSWLPVHVAAKFASKECLHFFAEEAGVNMHAVCDKGMTPFHWACGQGHLGAAIMLANLADKEWEERQLAMSIADREMRVHLEKLPRLNPDAEDNTGVSPLHEAASGGHLEVVRWLTEARKVDVAKKDHVSCCCFLCSVSLVRFSAPFTPPLFTYYVYHIHVLYYVLQQCTVETHKLVLFLFNGMYYVFFFFFVDGCQLPRLCEKEKRIE